MEKFEEPGSPNESTLEQLESLFQVTIGHETTLKNVQKSFYVGQYRKATVLITDDFNIYLSDRVHSDIIDKNGLGHGRKIDVEVNPAGNIKFDGIRDKALKRAFIDPGNIKALKEMDEDAATDLIKKAICSKVRAYIKERIDPDFEDHVDPDLE